MDRPNQQAGLPDASIKKDEDRPVPQPRNEYRCRYCTKMFPSSQALGGHQNAHKVQLAMEKAVRELHDNNYIGYHDGREAYPSHFKRSHYLVDRISTGNRLPPARTPYGMAWPRSCGIYSGCPRNIIPQSPSGNGAHCVHFHGLLNPRFSSNGAGGSGLQVRVPDLSGFASQSNRPGGNPGKGDDRQDEDDSGLDLSLKL